MKGAINVIAAALLLMLAGCAQKPAPEAGFRSQGAASYVHAHGLKVDMQLPQAFVGASTVIDAKVAQDAAKSSHNLIANSGNTAGLAGLLVASLINTQMGSGSLQRDAENVALKEARPMADLLAGWGLGLAIHGFVTFASLNGDGLRERIEICEAGSPRTLTK